jgi:hypothetical protein
MVVGSDGVFSGKKGLTGALEKDDGFSEFTSLYLV